MAAGIYRPGGKAATPRHNAGMSEPPPRDPETVRAELRESWIRVLWGVWPSLAATALFAVLTMAGALPQMPGLWPAFVIWIGAAVLTPLAYLKRPLAFTLGTLWGVPALAVILALNFQAVTVQGHSMQPTLHDGDVLLVDLKAEPEPLGVYVVEPPNGQSAALVKRLVGMPGQTLDARYWRLFADDAEVHPRLGGAPDQWNTERPVSHTGTLSSARRLGPAEYFVLGDNPPASRDSRAFGPVDRPAIRGRAVWSLRGSRGFAPVE